MKPLEINKPSNTVNEIRIRRCEAAMHVYSNQLGFGTAYNMDLIANSTKKQHRLHQLIILKRQM